MSDQSYFSDEESLNFIFKQTARLLYRVESKFASAGHVFLNIKDVKQYHGEGTTVAFPLMKSTEDI